MISYFLARHITVALLYDFISKRYTSSPWSKHFTNFFLLFNKLKSIDKNLYVLVKKHCSKNIKLRKYQKLYETDYLIAQSILCFSNLPAKYKKLIHWNIQTYLVINLLLKQNIKKLILNTVKVFNVILLKI